MDKLERQEYTETEWLGLMIKNEDLWETKTIGVEHFQSKSNHQLFLLLEQLISEKKPLDQPSTWNKLSETEKKRIGGSERIRWLGEKLIFLDEDDQKRIEAELHTGRAAKTVLDEAKKIANADYYELESCRNAADRINQTIEGVRTNRKSLKDKFDEATEHLLNATDELSGITTGYIDLDKALDGFQQKDLIIIGARPSMGKTAVTVNMFLKAAYKGYAATYIPAETGDLSILKRAIAIAGNLPVNAMKRPKSFLDPMQLDTFIKISKGLPKLAIDIEELQDIREIKQLVRERVKKHPDKKHVIFVDHIGHLRDGKTYPSKNVEYEEYAKQLKEIAKQYNVAIVLLSQLSRGVEKQQDKRPSNADLRDSGALEQIADVIIFLYRDSYYLNESQKNMPGEIELIITKNRDGGIGTSKYKFIPTTNRMIEL